MDSSKKIIIVIGFSIFFLSILSVWYFNINNEYHKEKTLEKNLSSEEATKRGLKEVNIYDYYTVQKVEYDEYKSYIPFVYKKKNIKKSVAKIYSRSTR